MIEQRGIESDEGPILLLAWSGFIIRNLLLGTFVDAVIGRRRLVVAVQNPRDERLREVVAGKPIELIDFPQKLWTGRRPLQRLLLWQTYMYHFKQAEKGTKAIEIQARLYDSQRSRLRTAFNRSLTRTGRLIKHLGLMGWVENRYLASIARWPVTVKWSEILERHRPAAVLSSMLTLTTQDWVSCDLPVVLAARARGIPCGTLVQSWDNLSSKTSVLPPWLDRYWTWSPAMSEELLTLNPRVSAERVRIVGSPQFDFHSRPDLVEPRERYLGRLGLDPARPVIVIGTGTAVRMPQEPATVVRLIRALEAALPKCQALVRLHPKDDGSRWAALRPKLLTLGAVIQETAPPVHMDEGGFVPPREFYRDQVNCLVHAAVVLNTSSTLTVDSAILDRPVVCLAYDLAPDPLFPEGRAWAYAKSTHYARLVETGGVAVVRSEEECVRAIRNYLEEPDRDREGRRRIVNVVTSDSDGGAGERLAAEVLALANGTQARAAAQRR